MYEKSAGEIVLRNSKSARVCLDNLKQHINDDRNTIVIGIDGTGELLDSNYKRSFENSFVNKIIRSSPAAYKKYIRGPYSDGADMGSIVGEGHEFFRLARAMITTTPTVLLTGYSRGGAGVIDLARRLKNEGFTVYGMMLFDPVDRSGASEGYDVPNNVLHMVQARRATLTLSRISFNNCAVAWHHPTKCERQFFWATHGGLGGCPWTPKLGFGEQDYVDENEYFNETGLSSTVYDVMRLEWHRPDDYHGSLDQLRKRRHDLLGDRTQVTYSQDRAGAEKVWQWALPRLNRLGFVAQK